MSIEGALTPLCLARLMTWLSPGCPVGAYAYSHGLEHAVEVELVGDPGTLLDWISWIVQRGGAWVDAVLFAEAWRARDDHGRLRGVAELAAAHRATAETALESEAQGQAFLRACMAASPTPALARLDELCDGRPAYAVAVAAACAGHGVPLGHALTAFAHAVAANLVSAGVRLVPLGQSDGQRVVIALEPVLCQTAARAAASSLDDLASAAPMVDWTSMAHETQYSRVFRS